MLNMFLVFALTAYAGAHLWRRREARFLRARCGALTVAGVGLLALAVYYAWTLRGGHGGQRESFSLANLAFAKYEWLGFGGLGPPRNVLREVGFAGAVRGFWPILLPGLVAWGALGVCAIANGRRLVADKVLWRGIAGLALGGWALAAAAIVARASLWGRHFLFVAPFFVLVMARVLAACQARRWVGYEAIAALLIGVFVMSSARQRFLPLYEKDPYRQAVAFLRDAARDERPAVWASYEKALPVYGGAWLRPDGSVGEARGSGRPAAVAGARWSDDAVRTWSRAHADFLLVVHRPDKFDAGGAWRRCLEREKSRVIWQQGNIRIYHVRIRS
jgi:hypothetical protein